MTHNLINTIIVMSLSLSKSQNNWDSVCATTGGSEKDNK